MSLKAVNTKLNKLKFLTAKRDFKKLNKKQRKQVNRIVDSKSELKFILPFLSSAASTSTPIITGLTDNAQGLGDSEHVGDEVRLCGTLEFKYRLNVDLGNDLTQQVIFIRVLMFQWHPVSASGGATEPTAANILLNGISGAPDTFSMYNHDTRQQYKIMYDRVHKLIGPGTATTNAYNPDVANQYTRRINLKKKKVHQILRYQAASSTNASNHIYVMTMSSVAADAQNPTLQWMAKVFYRDD